MSDDTWCQPPWQPQQAWPQQPWSGQEGSTPLPLFSITEKNDDDTERDMESLVDSSELGAEASGKTEEEPDSEEEE